jgi:hypothetical protein
MAAAILTVVGAALFAVASPVLAQTGSGIGTCTTVTGTTDVGSVAIGQQFVLQLAPTCALNPGAVVTVTVNGVSVPGKVVNASGQVLVTITVLSSTQLSIDDPVIAPAVCGVNTATVTGPSSVAVGGVATQTATFTVVCTATTVTTAPIVTSGSSAATPITTRLSLTGANSLRFVAIGLALVGIGALAVVATRRRRTGLTR